MVIGEVIILPTADAAHAHPDNHVRGRVWEGGEGGCEGKVSGREREVRIIAPDYFTVV